MNGTPDIGIMLLYLLYSNNITPNTIVNIEHELIKSSPVLHYLAQQGISIMQVAGAIYTEGQNERA